ncbi:fluoride efflux transporter FluC [Virgibacillus kekensis]|uniref:Fluoride-specific ion channel FluC n=1 Tax=Virgibacillus kekensis TaxID=202261 RepID=A0ABV9DK37_9BACI
MNLKVYLAVGLGGMIGATGRYGLSGVWAGSGFPFGTLAANLIGCFLLGYLIHNSRLRERLGSIMVSGLGTGMIGAFTTFSTFSVETVRLFDKSITLAAGYVLISLFGGLGLSYVSSQLAKRKQAVS